MKSKELINFEESFIGSRKHVVYHYLIDVSSLCHECVFCGFLPISHKYYSRNNSFAMSKIHEFNKFVDSRKDVEIRNYNKYYNDYVNHKEIKDLTENNFIQTSNKLNSHSNREKAEFNLFTEIVLKVCEKNKSWLSNCLFQSNHNYKRHESYNR